MCFALWELTFLHPRTYNLKMISNFHFCKDVYRNSSHVTSLKCKVTKSTWTHREIWHTPKPPAVFLFGCLKSPFGKLVLWTQVEASLAAFEDGREASRRVMVMWGRSQSAHMSITKCCCCESPFVEAHRWWLESAGLATERVYLRPRVLVR